MELFHATNDHGASAAARQAILDRGLLERFHFRNLHYPEVAADFRARGGEQTPAIWDGAHLIQGRDAVLALIDSLK